MDRALLAVCLVAAAAGNAVEVVPTAVETMSLAEIKSLVPPGTDARVSLRMLKEHGFVCLFPGSPGSSQPDSLQKKVHCISASARPIDPHHQPGKGYGMHSVGFELWYDNGRIFKIEGPEEITRPVERGQLFPEGQLFPDEQYKKCRQPVLQKKLEDFKHFPTFDIQNPADISESLREAMVGLSPDAVRQLIEVGRSAQIRVLLPYDKGMRSICELKGRGLLSIKFGPEHELGYVTVKSTQTFLGEMVSSNLVERAVQQVQRMRK